MIESIKNAYSPDKVKEIEPKVLSINTSNPKSINNTTSANPVTPKNVGKVSTDGTEASNGSERTSVTNLSRKQTRTLELTKHSHPTLPI